MKSLFGSEASKAIIKKSLIIGGAILGLAIVAKVTFLKGNDSEEIDCGCDDETTSEHSEETNQ